MNSPGRADWDVVRIQEGVVRSLAIHAAQEIDGVAQIAPGFLGTLWKWLTDQDQPQGMKVEMHASEVRVKASLIVEYGVNIPQVADGVRENIRQALERFAGITPTEIHVAVVGVAKPNRKR